MDPYEPQERRLWPFVVAAAATAAIALATAGAAVSNDGSSASERQPSGPDTVPVQQRQPDSDSHGRDRKDCPFKDGSRAGQDTLYDQS
jgi:hypothetical protein